MQLRLEMCRHLVATHRVWARLRACSALRARIIGTLPQIGGVRYVRHADMKNNPMHSRCAARTMYLLHGTCRRRWGYFAVVGARPTSAAAVKTHSRAVRHWRARRNAPPISNPHLDTGAVRGAAALRGAPFVSRRGPLPTLEMLSG